MPKLGRLKVLSLRNCGAFEGSITQKWRFKVERQLPSNKIIEDLILYNTSCVEISLENCDISSNFFQISFLRIMKEKHQPLRKLNISNNPLNSAGIQTLILPLSEAFGLSLTHLNLSNTNDLISEGPAVAASL